MDADLLDGQHGSYYRDLVNSTGTLPNARLSGSYDGLTEIGSTRLRLLATTVATVASTGHALQLGNDAGVNLAISPSRIQARSNGSTSSLLLNHEGGDVLINGSLAWHAGNDGAGSGMDADMLDGFQGSAYDRVTSQNLAQNGGFIVYASGRKECWGYVDVAKDATATITLPVNHTSWCLPIASATATGIGQTDNTGVSQIVSANQFRIMNGNSAQRVYWRSVGV
jgi:hypothetical protein